MFRTIRTLANSKKNVIISVQKLSENDLKIIKYANFMFRDDDQEIINDLERQKREKKMTKQKSYKRN